MIAQQLPGLPLDIITEILVHLPVKTLLRFKCVSKLFFTLISSRKFIDTHLNISSKNLNFTRVMLSSYYPRLYLKSYSLHWVHNSHPHNVQQLDYPLKDNAFFVNIVGSCNGLVCKAIDDDLFIWNPSTRVSKKINTMGLEVSHLDVYGFGLDESIGDYKVVRISDRDEAFKRSWVYSLRYDSWKLIADVPYKWIEKNPGKFVNGSLHFFASMGVPPLNVGILVALDLSNETYSEIEQPNYKCYSSKTYMTMGVLQGCVCILIDIKAVRFDLWVLKEYRVRDSWVKLCAIPYLFDPLSYWRLFPWLKTSSGELLMGNGNGFVLYNPSDGMFRGPGVPLHIGYGCGFIYVESLVSPIPSNC